MRQLPLSAPACLLALSPPGSTRETRLLWPITCDDDGGESKPLSFVMRKSGDGVARVEREGGGDNEEGRWGKLAGQGDVHKEARWRELG